MAGATSWKERLGDRIPESWGREIDAFETQLELRRLGRVEEKLFAESRLRRGAYGQRYDNGQRYDGEKTQELSYPGHETKGPGTVWDAPGMQRIKLPYGNVTADQLDVLAELAEEYSDGVLHVTTRQDFQLHFVHIEDTPDLMRRLAAVGITTREACGNSVRNVTQCPTAGVCSTEAFDTTPYAHALTFFLLGHDDCQDFGRKFKIAFSGCKSAACGLTSFHDLGAIAATRVVDGRVERGFELFVGGGLGAVPYAAQRLEEFVPEGELLPVSQAVCRVFARLGEKENRQRARLKFLVKKLGIDEFRRLVREERALLRPDPRWTAFLSDLGVTDETPKRPGAALSDRAAREAGVEFAAWRASNVAAQRQAGWVGVTLALALGDLTAGQARGLTDLARQYTDHLRTTVEQNLLLRWVSEADLPALHQGLRALGLADPGAGQIVDVTSCPGTDTCKLGISSSRGLAAVLRKRLEVVQHAAARDLRVKCSGCFNSCGQHHVADIGFLGVSRVVNGRRVPHFQLVVGGRWTENASAFGTAICAIPSRNAPKAVERLTARFTSERHDGEAFRDFVQRIGKKAVRALIEDLTQVPPYDVDPSYYTDWGDPREYTIADIGEGECAGAVVSSLEMGLASAERELFEAQLLLEQGQDVGAAARAKGAMLTAAKALTREKYPNLGDATDEIVREFRARLYDTKLFFDPFVGGKFAHYFFGAFSDHGGNGAPPREVAFQLIEETQLFVDAAYACHVRMTAAATRGAA